MFFYSIIHSYTIWCSKGTSWVDRYPSTNENKHKHYIMTEMVWINPLPGTNLPTSFEVPIFRRHTAIFEQIKWTVLTTEHTNFKCQSLQTHVFLVFNLPMTWWKSNIYRLKRQIKDMENNGKFNIKLTRDNESQKNADKNNKNMEIKSRKTNIRMAKNS